MAKWGEGDPRWVVEHREDGKNVNAWHWNEVPKISWCRERLGQLLPGVAAAVAPASIVVKEVKAVNGDASISTRKGTKKLALYDLSITCNWEGQLAGSDKTVEGEWKIEEFASGSDEDDYIITITATGSGAEQDELKRLAQQSLTPAVLKALHQMVKELSELQ